MWKLIKSRAWSSLKSDMLNALMQVAIKGPPVLESMPVVESAEKNWLRRKQRRKTKKVAISSTPMATVTEAAITEPMTVDAACQTTSPSISIKEERRVMKQQASALHLCVEDQRAL